MTQHEPSILGAEQYKRYSVLIPLIEKEGDIHLLFEVRSKRLRSQPGDVCFPGGKVDETDTSKQYAALRETSEELGVDQESITDAFSLGYLVTEGRIIYPFVGTLSADDLIQLNRQEVDDVFTVPLAFFLESAPANYPVYFKPEPSNDFPYELIQGGKEYPWKKRRIDEPFYQYGEYVIWGLTAKIIMYFVEILGK